MQNGFSAVKYEADRTLLNSPFNMSIKLILCTLIATLTVTWVDQLFISLVFHVHWLPLYLYMFCVSQQRSS